MTIVITTKADLDAKNAVCQCLSQYRKMLRTFENSFSPYSSLIESQDVINVPPAFFTKVKANCDALNDSIDRVQNVLKNPDLPLTEYQKRKSLPWYDSMSAWAHDSRAFIQNIYPIVRDYQGCHVHSAEMHSLIALQSALVSMARMFEYELLERKCENETVECEIYKLFDKFKKCYRGKERAFWKRSDSGFYSAVRCAKGFEAVPLNLYANAFKYLPPLHPIDHSIEVSFDEDKTGVRVIVSSVGPLVPEEEISKLWEPGVRSSSAILATDEGYGLGLPTVKRLCDVSDFLPSITSEHRSHDDEGWGLFTVSIFVPRSAYVDNFEDDCLQG
mgnify:CR=1 FL=1